MNTSVSATNLPFIPGAKVLLLGESGSGKTYSFRTLLEAGVQTFVIFTEPGMRAINDVPCSAGLHYRYIPPATPEISVMKLASQRINQAVDLEDLTKKKDWNKTKYQQFLTLLGTLENFTCDRCGKSFGMVDTWGHDRALIIDSLSGLSIMSMDLVAGSKPVKAPADWGTAMDNLERLILRLCTGIRTHFILAAHLERERDEVTGGVKLMASTLGQKLAPKLPRNFDDVILAQDLGSEWIWSTSSSTTALKTRNLTKQPKLPASFKPLIESWKAVSGFQTTEELSGASKPL